jgi:hypothetical protein
MPSLDFIVNEELDRAPVGTKALTHERTARMQAKRNIFLYGLEGIFWFTDQRSMMVRWFPQQFQFYIFVRF